MKKNYDISNTLQKPERYLYAVYIFQEGKRTIIFPNSLEISERKTQGTEQKISKTISADIIASLNAIYDY